MKIKYELTKEEVTEIISNYIINKKGNIDVSSISYLCTEHRDNGVGCGWYDLDRVDIICQE